MHTNLENNINIEYLSNSLFKNEKPKFIKLFTLFLLANIYLEM